MRIVGVDPARTLHTLCVLNGDRAPHVIRNLNVQAALDFLSPDADDVRLVVIEQGQGELQDNIDALVNALRAARIPVLTVNVNTWKTALGIRTKALKGERYNGKALIRDYIRDAYPHHPDLRNQHRADALLIAHYAKHVLLQPRARQRLRKPDRAVRLADPLLWRYWPQFAQEGLPNLYGEFLRQCSPDEPFLGRDPTCANAGIANKRFDAEIDALAEKGLLERRGDVLTLFAPWDVVPDKADVPAASEADPLALRLERLIRRLRKVYQKTQGTHEAPDYTPEEIEAIRSVLDVADDDTLTDLYGGLQDFDAYTANMPDEEDSDFENRYHIGAYRALNRIKEGLASGKPHLLILADSARDLAAFVHVVAVSDARAERAEELRQREERKLAAATAVAKKAHNAHAADPSPRAERPPVPYIDYQAVRDELHDARLRIDLLEERLLKVQPLIKAMGLRFDGPRNGDTPAEEPGRDDGHWVDDDGDQDGDYFEDQDEEDEE